MLVSMFFLVVIAACAMDETQTEDSNLTETSSAEETAEESMPLAARTVEEIINQKAGVLVETYSNGTNE